MRFALYDIKKRLIMKPYLLAILLAAALSSGCVSQNPSRSAIPEAEQQNSVPYTMAANYFVRNDVDNSLITRKITSAGQLEEYFGTAATMGNLPTPIDFSRQYAVAIITPTTNRETSIAVKRFTSNKGKLTITYRAIEGAELSYTTRPFLLLLVDNDYKGKLDYRGERLDMNEIIFE